MSSVFLRESSYSKAIALEIKTIKTLYPFNSVISSSSVETPPYLPECLARPSLRAVPPSPYLPVRLSPASLAHSLLPSLRLSIRSPRLPFVTLAILFFRLSVSVSRTSAFHSTGIPRRSHLCPMLYHYHGISISIRFNRYVIVVQCPHRAVSHAFRMLCVFISNSRHVDISFYYFLMLKIMSF